jgi:hypothetical protein
LLMVFSYASAAFSSGQVPMLARTCYSVLQHAVAERVLSVGGAAGLQAR